MENKSQLTRLLFIDRKIREGMQAGNLANCTSLADEYEVSTKTILRDIDYLRINWDAPIEYDSSRKGYLYSQENFALPAIHINEGDLFGLLVAQKGLEQYRGTPIFDSLSKVFTKIEKSLPEHVSIQSGWLDSRITVLPEQHTTINPDIWDTIARGLQQGLVVAICYRKPGGRGSRRKVDPYHVTKYQGEWYLIGYCHRRNAVRTFAVSRVSGATLCKEPFARPADFDYETFIRNSFGIIRGSKTYKVKLRFSKKEAPFVLERTWQPEQKILKHRNGTVTLTLTATDLFEIKRWILSWGPEVSVLSPKKLAAAVTEDLRKALQGYEK